MCYYSATTQPLDTEVAPSVGVLVSPPIFNSVQTSSVDCHNVIIGANHATQHFQLLSGASECF
jgi:hypothetical protein